MKKSFTLIELIVVIAIIAILAAIIAPNAFKAIEKAKITNTIAIAKVLKTAGESYYADIRIWPADVSRGYDPGFMKSNAYNPDLGIEVPLPTDSAALITAHWDGPYLERWPASTSWGGKYDWNFWAVPVDRYGVIIPAGCYVGVQGDYTNANTIPEDSEQTLIEKGHDAGGSQINGEIQLTIVQF